MGQIAGGAADYAIAASSLQNAVSQIQAIKAQGVSVDRILIIGHGQSGYQRIGDYVISPYGEKCQQALQELGGLLAPTGDIYLMGCMVASGRAGKTNAQKIADLTGRNVVSYDWWVQGTLGPSGKTTWSFPLIPFKPLNNLAQSPFADPYLFRPTP